MNKPLRILHLEDNRDYFELVKAMLEEAGLGVEMVHVCNHKDFASALEQGAFDLILGDYKLPTCTGLEALATARQECPDTPFLLVSGTIGERAAIESLRSGATDYVLKQWPERLVPTVRRAVQEAQERVQRKRAEAELVRREKYFRALTDNSLDVLTILKSDGAFHYNSPSVKQVLGYEPEELAGRNVFELVHPADVPGAMRAFEQGLKNPELRVSQELRFRHRDGSWRHLEVVGQNRLDDPEMAGVVLNTRDISERKRAEETLRASEERFRNVFEEGPIGMVLTSRDLRFASINPAFCQMLNYTEAELRDKSFIEVTHPECLSTDRENVELMWQGKIPSYRREKRYLAKDGGIRWGSMSTSLIRGVGGEPLYALAMIEDITERKEAEGRLHLQSAALEAAANAILLADRAGTVLWVNAAFSRLTGYSAEEIVGQKPRLLKSGKHDLAFYKNLWDTILAGRGWRAEMVNRRKDGSFYTEENTITPVRSEQGEITHFIAVKQDITARKELESQLRQAQKMEAIGKLAGGVAHDFNNILTVIQGHASLLSRGGGLTAQGASSADQILRASERAAGLTRQLLAFSRRQLLQPRLLDLNEVVGNLSKMLGRILGEDMTLELSYSPEPALLQADASMMDQVLMNLAVNARDAMPQGGRLDVSVSVVEIGAAQLAPHAEGRAGRFVCLSVADNGCGIPAENLARIFEPFFTTKEVGKGTGLGLATVYGIVKQHGGWVQVESAVGQGTRFRVYLPASVESAMAAGDQAVQPQVRGGRETILVVEDEAPVRELICRSLADGGYQILEAASGVKALEIWRQCKDRIDLLLTDLVMPDQMNGWELAETLWSERPGLKVIFTTGYGMDVAGKEFVLRRGKNLLQKPYSPQALALAVRDCLDTRREPGKR